MSLTRFWLQPLDTLYFGPPNASTAGESHTGESLFPSPISAFQGMIRTKLLTSATESLDLSGHSQGRIEALIGTPERLPEGWQLEGPFPVAWRSTSDEDEHAPPVAQPWIPMPRFLLGKAHEVPQAARVLDDWSGSLDTQRSLNDLSTRFGGNGQVGSVPWLLGLAHPPKAKVKPLEGWLSVDNLHWALTGEGQWQQEGFGAPLPPFVKYERRAGVAIDPEKGSAVDQMLFFQKTLRFATGSGLAGWLEAPLNPPLRAEGLQEGSGRAGKATRLVSFDPLGDRMHPLSPVWRSLESGKHLLPERIESVLQKTRSQASPHASPQASLYAWLVLISPVHLPTDELLFPRLRLPDTPVQVHVRGALLGDMISEGGYFSVEKKVRPNRPRVPGGSCWLLELRGGDASSYSTVLSALNAHHPLGDVQEGRMGYGLTLVGLAEPLWTKL